MNKRILTLLLLTLIPALSIAQQVSFCKNYTRQGKPVEEIEKFRIKPWGSFLYVLMDNGENRIADEEIFMFVDRKQVNRYKPYDHKKVMVHDKKNWVVYNYKFTETGTYFFYFEDGAGARLASGTLVVVMDDEHSSSGDFAARTYYGRSRLTFSDIIMDGKPFNKRGSVSINDDGGKVYIYLDNGRPINSDTLYVDFRRMNNRTYAYDEFIDDKKYKIEPDWPDTFFPYVFTANGKFKVAVYNENRILIAEGYIEVKN